MSPLLTDIIIFLIGIVSSFVGSVAAGTGLVAVPALLFLGLPPQVTLGSFNFGYIGTAVGNIVKFSQFKNMGVSRKDVLILTLLCVSATVLGSLVVVSLPAHTLTKIIGIVLLVLLPVLFIKGNFGVVPLRAKGIKRIGAHIAYFLVNAWSGFFSPGSGILETYVRVYGYGYTILEGKAATRIPLLLSGIASAVVFAISGFIKYDVAIILFGGMFVGGYVGTSFAIKKGNKWIKPFLGLIILITAIKMLFF